MRAFKADPGVRRAQNRQGRWLAARPTVWYFSRSSGNNSVVECDLAKVEVAGSNPVSRSNFRSHGLRASDGWQPSLQCSREPTRERLSTEAPKARRWTDSYAE